MIWFLCLHQKNLRVLSVTLGILPRSAVLESLCFPYQAQCTRTVLLLSLLAYISQQPYEENKTELRQVQHGVLCEGDVLNLAIGFPSSVATQP